MTEQTTPVSVVSTHQPVMGTHLELRITAASVHEARAAEASILADAHRLERVFTVFDPASELCRWRSGATAEVGVELSGLLARAAWWHERSGGAFNPLTGVLTDRWHQAEQEQALPSADELAELTCTIAEPRFVVSDDGRVHPLGDCGPLDLNALAKGHVVDLVVDRAFAAFDLERLVVNAGGDLVHRGAEPLRVGVEDPHRPYDNAAPLAVLAVQDRAVATSGRARRWFTVDGVRRSRVLDPRTGQPVVHTASATVVAPDATTADAVATVASVLAPREAVAFVDGLVADGIDAACLVVTDDDGVRASAGWSALEVRRAR